jgi:peptide/nickel transport system substrate-binding protein
MHRRALWLLAGAALVVLALSAAAPAGTAKQSAAKPKTGGTLVFGAEQEPECWNSVLADCSLFWGTLLTQPMLQSAYQIFPDYTLRPQLISSATVTKNPFSITFNIRPEAKWNDGVPVSADDFIFTWKTYVNPKNDLSSREGYDQITSGKKLSAKKVKFAFKKPYAPWQYLWQPVFPAHALQGSDFNSVWDKSITNPKNGKPISNGPFQWGAWQQGAQLTLNRNPNYWGWSPSGKLHKGYLDKLVMRFITNTNSEIQAMKSGEVDMIYPQPQLALADLKKQSGVKIQSNPGALFEGLTWNLDAKKGGPLMRSPAVRQALQYSVDRKALVKQLFGTLKPDLTPLQSNMYVQTQKEYKPLFTRYTYNLNKVNQLMQKIPCQKGGDGIWVCQGQRMSYNFGTTAGNQLRELAFEIMQAQAKKAGFELKAAFQPAGVFFSADGVFGGNFQIAQYADVGTGDPGGFTSSFKCGGEANYGKFCSNKVTKFLEAADQELDPAKRAIAVNKAVALMSVNTPRFPLYQKPTFLVYKTKVLGLVDNGSVAGPTWNVMEWSLS